MTFHQLFHNGEAGAGAAAIDLSAVVVGHCLSKGKPLVIEDLDFQDKKRSLKDLPKDHRRMLSAFAYAEFKKRLHSKSRALGVRLEKVNPAYTSLIGAYKFRGFAISTHEKAAFVIARRSQGYSEDPEVFHGTRPAHESPSGCIREILDRQNPEALDRVSG